MSALFGPQNFQERLQLAFRGSAKEQKKAKKDFFRERGGISRALSIGGAQLGGSVFATKRNLGGTPR